MSFKYLLLGFLDSKPYSGYEIKQLLDHTIHSFWPVSYGQLYPTLHALLKANLIEKTKVPGKRALEKIVYSITPKGREVFFAWLVSGEKKYLWRTNDDSSLLFFFAPKLGKDRFREEIQKAIAVLTKKKESLSDQYAFELKKNNTFTTGILRKNMLHVEAEITWLMELVELHERKASTESE